MVLDAVELLCTSTSAQGVAALAQKQQQEQLHQLRQLEQLEQLEQLQQTQHMHQLQRMQQLQQIQQQQAALLGWHFPPHLLAQPSLHGTPHLATQVPGYIYPGCQPAIAQSVTSARPGTPPLPSGGDAAHPPTGDATRQSLLTHAPSTLLHSGLTTSWALEERLKAEQARAQQMAWAESMRAHYLGVTPMRASQTPQTPQKSSPQKGHPQKNSDVTVAFDRLLLLSKLGAAWDQHQAEKQLAGKLSAQHDASQSRVPTTGHQSPPQPSKGSKASPQHAKDDDFRTPVKTVAPRWRARETRSPQSLAMKRPGL